MPVNLMQLAKEYLDQQVISQMGGIVGESAEKTKWLSAALCQC